MDSKYLMAIAAVFCLWLAYDKGYENAETEYNLKIESMKLDHANEVIKAQEKEKERYEAKTKELSTRYANDHAHYLDRVRKLEAKLRSRPDLETCINQRNRATELAVRAEGLAERSLTALELTVKY